MKPIKEPCLLTVDLEDYFHASAYRHAVGPRHWPHLESRLDRNTHVMLDLLDTLHLTATFFVLGWVAQNRPDLVRAVSARGHEIAAKCYLAGSPAELGLAEIERRLKCDRDAVEQACGVKVLGNRFSIAASRTELCLLELTAATGFKYDSSVLARYGFWSAQFVNCGGVVVFEVPFKSAYDEMSLANGTLSHKLISDRKQVGRSQESPLRIHLWELDPAPPRLNGASSPNAKNAESLLRERSGTESVSISKYLKLPDQRLQALTKPRTTTIDVPGRSASARSANAKLPVTVIVPCYNEISSLTYLQSTLQSFEQVAERDYSIRFIFVDDGSSDGTLNALHILFGSRQNAAIISHGRNKGVAASILTGISNAQTEIVCSMDSDCTYDPLELLSMIPQLRDGVDLVTASPYHPLGSVRNVPAWRLILSKGSSFLYRLVLPWKLFTYTSCFRVYRRPSVMNLQLREPGYLGVAEMAASLALRGAQMREHPAILESRILGTSKMKILRTIAGHLRLLARIVRTRLAQRFFSPYNMPDNAFAAGADLK